MTSNKEFYRQLNKQLRSYNEPNKLKIIIYLFGLIAFIIGVSSLPIHYSFKLIILGFILMLIVREE